MEKLVAITRSGIVESIHTGYICVVNSRRETVAAIGSPDTKFFPRSSGKLFIAVPFVHYGVMDHFRVSEEELAVVCSSHSGEDYHRAAVQSILGKAGLDESYLECGKADPYNKKAYRRLLREGRELSPLYNCCSGKHAGMLLTCRYFAYPTEGYTEPGHPVQRLIRAALAEMLAIDPDGLLAGTDGCGVPTYLLTLQDGAYLYSLLASGAHGEGKFSAAFERIKNALIRYPLMVNGHGEFCTELIAGTAGRVIGKVGAEGIYGLAVPEKQYGAVVKLTDGNERGLYPAVISLLRQTGAISDAEVRKLHKWAMPVIKSHRGETIGHAVAIYDLEARSAGADRIDLGAALAGCERRQR